MALYYYNRYHIATGWVMTETRINGTHQYTAVYGYTSYTTSVDGQFASVSGNQDYRYHASGATAYINNGPGVIKHVPIGGNYEWNQYDIRGVHQAMAGELSASGISAENGTYPTNGAQGGYWYIRGSAVPVNTAPTTPGVFTQPTGTLEIGDSKTISWGGSSDADGNLQRYYLEASINNGAWTSIGTPTSPNFTYTIPTATTIKFRVRAYDSGGLYSAYRESSALTVTPPMYYWSKYSTQTNYTYGEGAWVFLSSETGYNDVYGHTSYSFDSSTGNFTLTGTQSYIDRAVGGTRYVHTGSKKVHRYTISGGLLSSYDKAATGPSTSYSRGSLIQSGIIAIEGAYPNNGHHYDGYWYVRGSRVNQTIAPTGSFTAPTFGKVFKPGEVAAITFEASGAPNISLYEVDYSYNGGAWTTLAHNNTLTRTLVITTDKALINIQFRVRAKNTSNVYSDYVHSEVFTIQHNAAPTLLLSTENNETLYETDVLKVNGSSIDTDVGNIITIKYQVNNETIRTLDTYTSTGNQEAYSKDLVFKSNKLFDGTTEVTGVLPEGVQNAVKVWAEDNDGGISPAQSRTFYVVANRPPVITVQSATFPNFVWTAKELDAGDAVVNTKLTLNTEVLRSVDNPTFPQAMTIPIANLTEGENTLTITATDKLGSTTTKTYKLDKKYSALPETQLTSVALDPTDQVKITLKRPEGTAASKIYKILGGYSL